MKYVGRPKDLAAPSKRVVPPEQSYATRRQEVKLVGIPLLTLLAGAVFVLLFYALWQERSPAPNADEQASHRSSKNQGPAGAECCSKRARAQAASQTALQLTDEILALGPRVGGGANPLGDGYYRVLELLATRPPWLPYRDTLHKECPCLVSEERVSRGSDNENFLWKLSWDNFTDSTPLGPKSFSNILWTFDPSLLVVREKQAGSTGTARSMKHRPQKHVVLAAHWDSKLLPAEVSGGSEKFFVGACDSAVPVAMVITLMHVIQEAAVAAAKLSDETAKFTVMLFDGEEAFVEWQGLDNTYGSRHLAAQWAAAGSGGPDGSNLLSSISLFILFDLLGPFGPTFRNFFPEQTGDSYQLMRRIETSLRKKSLLKTTSRRNADPQRWSGSFFPSDAGFPREVEDDHKPWRARNVSVLHLISLPFPSVWHTVHDDRQAVDDDTVHDLMAIFEEFVRRVMRSAK